MTRNKKIVLGIHFGHDAGAAILVDGQIIADVSEERFNRVKHSADDPFESISYCLKYAGVKIEEVDEIAVAGLKSGDQIRNVFGFSKRSPQSFRERIYGLKRSLSRFIKQEQGGDLVPTPVYLRKFFSENLPKITIVEHHLAHAASAYYTSNYQGRIIVATVDGIGDKFSSCIWLGENGKLQPLVKYGSEGSIGWFYSNVTEALGWWHGDGEGKTMGLAPYGDFKVCEATLDGFYPRFKNGRLETPYNFPPVSSYRQSGTYHWHSDDALRIKTIVDRYGKENVAAEAQRVLEKEVMEFVLPWLKECGTHALATSGGVFLNVKLNQHIWSSGQVNDHFPYPNPGDSGLALGAALYVSAGSGEFNKKRSTSLYTGPEFSNEEIEDILKKRGLEYYRSEDVAIETAKMLAENKIVGWFQGRMESGPRALGNRSILMSPKKAENKDVINARVKFREAFRPFCPSLIEEAKDKYLVNARREAFMVTSFDCQPARKEELPAVVHVDGTLRPQTVTKEDNPRYWKLINEFGKLTGTPVLLNTSMNIRGEPMVCSPREAIRCFFDSGIDVLVLGDFILRKQRQPEHEL